MYTQKGAPGAIRTSFCTDWAPFEAFSFFSSFHSIHPDQRCAIIPCIPWDLHCTPALLHYQLDKLDLLVTPWAALGSSLLALVQVLSTQNKKPTNTKCISYSRNLLFQQKEEKPSCQETTQTDDLCWGYSANHGFFLPRFLCVHTGDPPSLQGHHQHKDTQCLQSPSTPFQVDYLITLLGLQRANDIQDHSNTVGLWSFSLYKS